MAKYTPKHVRRLIAQFETLIAKEEEHGITDLVHSWEIYLEAGEKTILNKYRRDKNQLELQFEDQRQVFKKEMAGKPPSPANTNTTETTLSI